MAETEYNVSGSTPLSITAKEEDSTLSLNSLTLYGGYSQDGIPTPDNPIPVVPAGAVMTTGAQLFDKDNITLGFLTGANVGDSVTITKNTSYPNAIVFNEITIEENSSVYVYYPAYSQNGNFRIRFYNDNNICTQNTLSGNVAGYNEYVQTSNGTTKIRVMHLYGTTTAIPTDSFIISEVKSDYEPYTGGVPMARQDKGEVNITISTTNLIDITSYPALSADVIRTILIAVKNGTYTLSSNIPEQSSLIRNLFFLAGSASGRYDSATNGVSSEQPRTVTTTDGYVRVGYRTSTSANELDPRNYQVMLNEGSSALPYQPYAVQTLSISTLGGFPAVPCTNSYSQAYADYTDEEGNMYCANVITLKKGETYTNLFSITEEELAATFQRNCTAVLSGDTITITITATGTDCYIGNGISAGTNYSTSYGVKIPVSENTTYAFDTGDTNLNKNYISYFNSSNVSLGFRFFNNTSTGTFTTPEGAEYCVIRVGNGSSVAGDVYYAKIIIVEGSEIPTEPYTTGTLTQNVGFLELTGDEEIYRESLSGVYYFKTALADTVSVNQRFDVLSNRFVYSATSRDIGTIYTYGGYLYLYPNDSSTIMSTTEFKEWLAENHTYVYYIKATPTIIDLTSEEIAEFEALEMYTPTTTIDGDAYYEEVDYIETSTPVPPTPPTPTPTGDISFYLFKNLAISNSRTIKTCKKNNTLYALALKDRMI